MVLYSLSRRPRERGCQEILRTDNSSFPRKRGPRACPWHEQGGKRLKSLGSRFRGNDEQRGAKVGCAELDYSLESGDPEPAPLLSPGAGSGMNRGASD